MSDAWEQYWSKVGNENYLAARRLAAISPRVQHFFARFIRPNDYDGVDLDWDAAAEAIDADGMSSTEGRLAHLIAALTAREVDGSPWAINLLILGRMDSWADEVLEVLVDWASDGRLGVHRLVR